MTSRERHPFVLAISLTNKGFGFVLFDGAESPFDWGIKRLETADKNAVATQYVTKLFRRYRPEVLVLEDLHAAQHRRCKRNRILSLSLAHIAEKDGAEVCMLPRAAINQCFAAAGATKYDIASLISCRIPAFASRMPRVRKCYMAIDIRQSLFDAAALGLVFYQRAAGEQEEPP